LVLSLGILYLIALLDKSMHTERDAELCLNLPVLAMIPVLETPGNLGKQGLLGDGALQGSGAD
jgi:hypothetical protein